jgi:hypothetical protein
MNRNPFIAFLLAVVALSFVPMAALAAEPFAFRPRLAPDYFQVTPDKDIPYKAGILVGEFVNNNDHVAMLLPRHWRAVYAIYTLEASRNSDGLDGFFFNSKGNLDNVIEKDLPYVGATPYVKLFSEARKIYYDTSMSEDARSKALNRLDDQFSAVEEKHTLSDYLRDFMKSHQALFLQ